jgi:hypothetical protein
MVTKGYRKGVYEWVTLGIIGETSGVCRLYPLSREWFGKGTISVVLPRTSKGAGFCP